MTADADAAIIATLRRALAHGGPFAAVVVPTAGDVLAYLHTLTRLLAGRPVHDLVKKHGEVTVKLDGLTIRLVSSDRDAWVNLADKRGALVLLEGEDDYAPRDRAAWRKWALIADDELARGTGRKKGKGKA